MDYKLQRANSADTQTIHRLLQNVDGFQVNPNQIEMPWTMEQLSKWIESKDDIVLISKDNNKIVGFILVQVHTPTGKATIENLFVLPDYRSHGIALTLISETISMLKKTHVSYIVSLVKTNNQATLSLLEKSSFSKGFSFVWMDRAV